MGSDKLESKVKSDANEEIKKASFWISQIFILLATVIGVYLAANQGYKQAVQFDNMKSYKDNYYLQKSLQYELTDNISILKAYLVKCQDSNYFGARTDPLSFYTLVWENMKFSSTTLGTPPELLRDAQRFYREVDRIHNEIAKGNIAISVGVTQLQEQIDHIEKELLPALDSSTKKIEKILEGTDVVL
ncbi:hypothetical protein A9G11_01350 [Gilliamella sp. wkB108]|uniref:hypothetical protein n=1 Tax=Gilliamella sp. wkB108 TaxID=3120256 RepID=UPI00080DCD69|nr:hypothetical protein [Gilliamella apicola]OCG26003.1 hypothetical protein A9G11_01350 [Gilliamella apicola]